MSEWHLCELSFSCYAAWAQQFQPLIAGLLAILAACIVYTGARGQAKATRHVAASVAADSRKSSAAALWAELYDCGRQLRRDALTLEHTPHTIYMGDPHLRPLKTEIFDANPAAVGLFEPTVTVAVTRAYKWIKEMSSRYTPQPVPAAIRTSAALASDASHASERVHEALAKLAPCAGISTGDMQKIDKQDRW